MKKTVIFLGVLICALFANDIGPLWYNGNAIGPYNATYSETSCDTVLNIGKIDSTTTTITIAAITQCVTVDSTTLYFGQDTMFIDSVKLSSGSIGDSLKYVITGLHPSDSVYYSWRYDEFETEYYKVFTEDSVSEIVISPVITVQPHDSTVTEGQSVSFSVTATNATGYQWYGNGSLIPGATGTTYSFTATIALSGSAIYCMVYNATDTISSDTVTLTVSTRQSSNTKLNISQTFKPRYTATETVISNFDGGVGIEWVKTSGLIAVDDNAYIRNGTKSIKLTSDVAPATDVSIRKNLAGNYSTADYIILTFHVDDSIKVAADPYNFIGFNFTTSTGNFFYKEYNLAAANPFDSGWYKISLHKGTFAKFGSADWANITQIYITMKDRADIKREMTLDQLSYCSQPTGAGVVFWFDASSKNIITYAKPIFDRYGFKFTQSVKAQYIGTEGVQDVEDLNTLKNNNFDLVSYPWDSDSLTKLTIIGVDTQLTKVKTYMVNNGFSKWPFLAYSQAAHNRVVDSIAVSKGFEWFRGSVTHNTVSGIPFMPIPQFSHRSFLHYTYTTQTTGTLTNIVDTIIKYKLVSTILFHGVDTIGASTVIDTTKLVALLDYCSQKITSGDLGYAGKISNYFSYLPIVRQSTDTLILVCSAENYDSIAWFLDGSVIAGATDSTLTVLADSAFYSTKHEIQSVVYNSEGSVICGTWRYGNWGANRSRWGSFLRPFKDAFKRAFK